MKKPVRRKALEKKAAYWNAVNNSAKLNPVTLRRNG